MCARARSREVEPENARLEFLSKIKSHECALKIYHFSHFPRHHYIFQHSNFDDKIAAEFSEIYFVPS